MGSLHLNNATHVSGLSSLVLTSTLPPVAYGVGNVVILLYKKALFKLSCGKSCGETGQYLWSNSWVFSWLNVLGIMSLNVLGSCDLGAQFIIKLRERQRPSENLREPRHNIPRSIAKFMYCAVYELAAVYCLRGGLRGSLWGRGEGPAR